MPKVGEVLKFRDGGVSVEEAREAMLAAKQVPRGLTNATAIPTMSEDDGFEPEGPVEVAVVPAKADLTAADLVPEVAPPLDPVPVVEPTSRETKFEVVETAQFTTRIGQEGGEWVAEIRYKPTEEQPNPGVERFTAATKNALMLELAKGKGNATLRVRKAIRREKLGRELDKSYPLPDYLTSEKFQKLPQEQQDDVLLTIQFQQSLAFREANPDYYTTAENGRALVKFLDEQKLPVTVRNLGYAFEELTESGLLATRPVAEKVLAASVLANPAAAPAVGDSPAVATVNTMEVAPATPVQPVAVAPVVRKRASSGLQPGQSSTPSVLITPEEGREPRELSVAELKKIPLSDLKRIADEDRRKRAGTQR